MPLSCKSCLYTENHPLGITFTEGECSGCFTHKEKNVENWNIETSRVNEVLAARQSKGTYDCVVPVVGDAEDYFTLSTILAAGMAPLVVCVNDYFKNDIGWHNLHNLITHFDVDSFVFNPDMTVYKELVRTSLRKHNHVLLPFLQLHTSFPVHVALQRNIPLVVWGQNQAVEQVGKFSHLDEVAMSRWYRNENDLFNTDIHSLIGSGAQVQERLLNYYQYPEPQSLHKKSVSGIYLSNYIPWDPFKQNAQAVEQGFIPQDQTATFDPYERAGSSIYYGIHDLLKLKRVGYRKVTDHLTREIRHKRVTQKHAKELEKLYTNTPVSIRPFFDWLGSTSSGYKWFVKHRLADVEHLIGVNSTPAPRDEHLTKDILSLKKPSELAKNHFIVFGKGISL